MIYSHQDCDKDLTKEHFTVSFETEIKRMRPKKGYVNFYKLGIGLPESKEEVKVSCKNIV